jgi:O-antigen/teichoic acid export membrane protein
MIKKLFSSQLRINMVSGMATTVVNIAVMAAGYPIYLHFLGYEKYGVWLILAVVLTFAQLGDLGINPAITKLVAEEYGRKSIEGIQCYITTALAMLCLSGIIVLAVVLIFKLQIISLFKLNSENAKLAAWLLPYIGILSIYIFIVNVFNAAISGLGRMDLANYIQTASKVIAVVVATVLLYLGRGIESMIISSAVSYLFIHMVSIICVRKMISIRILHISNLNAQCGQRLLSFGGAVFGGSLIGMLLSPFNKLMLSRYAGVSTVPIYEIAYTGSMQVRALIESGLRALMPEISRIGADITIQATNKISQLNSRAMKLILMFGIPIYGVLVIFTPLLLMIWLGGKFTETLPGAFRIMLIGTFLSLVGVPAYYTLMGTRYVRYTLVSYIIQSTVNVAIVISCVLLFSTVSANVIVVSTSLGMGASTVYLIRCKQKALGLLPVIKLGM